MEIWGITGLMGAGKSTAVKILAGRGYPVIDADVVAREVVDPRTALGRQGLEQVVRAFGKEILQADGTLDRRRLREKIAASVTDRDRLERVLHPLILGQIDAATRRWQSQNKDIGFVEGSRLVESGYAGRLKKCILVEASESTRLERVLLRDRLTADEARAVFRLQNEERMRGGCHVFWANEGDHEGLRRQIDEFLKARLGLES